MNSRVLAATCLSALVLAACNFPSGSQPVVPRLAPTPARDLAVASQYLAGLRAVSYDPFDSLRDWMAQPGTSTLQDGRFEMRGTPLWQSHVIYRQGFTERQGLVVGFSARSANGNSELVFVSGDWLTSSFRQFGVYNAARPLTDLFQGAVDLGGNRLSGNLRLHPGTAYELLLAVGRGGRLLGVAWDPASQSDRAVFDLQGGTSWAGRDWIFMPKATQGETISLDNFYRIAFADIK